jgi:TRAP-type C4-dicarboxylate transport system permease small subunit
MAQLGWDWVNLPESRTELGATTQLPRWYNYSALPLAMATLAFHQFAAVLRHLRAALWPVDAPAKGAAA